MARAIEKWGGPSQVAEDLAYAVPPRKGKHAAAQVPKPSAATQETISHQALGLASLDEESTMLSTTKITVKPAAARHQAAVAKSGRRPTTKASKQERLQIPSPAALQAREKLPIVNNRRRIAVRRKEPRM